ncbi:MAG: ABC transporter ATP-binding protein, partial [Burkholderiaceae bacterium]
GKSTLLQMVCGTLAPSVGTLAVRGRVAALLELGAGFNPDFTGLENVFMNGAILGLKKAQVQEKLAEILAFADIGEFIHQPVKTYSSGMFMRLAFSVATSVDPEVLVIDEALSVGDGAFARKSFERIMGLKDAGKTILFCSHSMYQVEALCARALWIEGGQLRMDGPATEVTSAYNAHLAGASGTSRAVGLSGQSAAAVAATGTGRIVKVTAQTDGQAGHAVALQSQVSDLRLEVD